MDLRPLPWQGPAMAALAALRARGAHALLMTGRAGIGKLQLALAFGAAVLCTGRGGGPAACGRCPACLLLAAGSHPDLLVVTPDALKHLRPARETDGDDEDDEGSEAEAADEAGDAPAEDAGKGRRKAPSKDLRIEQIHRLSALASVGSHQGGSRVVVLVPADALNGPAANALLKTLEEPPGDTLFLLVTAAPEVLLPTIRSRCIAHPVRPPTRQAALAWLQEQGVPGAEAEARLDEAGGAPLHALVPPADRLDPALRDALVGLLRQGGRFDPADVVAAVGRQVPVGPAIALMQRWAWDLLTVRLGGRVLYHPRDRSTLTRLSAAAALPALWGWLDALREARASADHPLNARLVVEQALLRYRIALSVPAPGSSQERSPAESPG